MANSTNGFCGVYLFVKSQVGFCWKWLNCTLLWIKLWYAYKVELNYYVWPHANQEVNFEKTCHLSCDLAGMRVWFKTVSRGNHSLNLAPPPKNMPEVKWQAQKAVSHGTRCWFWGRAPSREPPQNKGQRWSLIWRRKTPQTVHIVILPAPWIAVRWWGVPGTTLIMVCICLMKRLSVHLENPHLWGWFLQTPRYEFWFRPWMKNGTLNIGVVGYCLLTRIWVQD